MKKHFLYSTVATAVCVALSPAMANQDSVVLDEINVVGSVAKAGKVDYMTPRSVSVLESEKLKNWQQNQLDSALRYESGALAQTFGADLDTNDWFKIRGLDSRLTVDGTAVYNSAYSHWRPNMYGVEAVEIVKGADALTYGSAQAGGLINLITKRPTAEPQNEVNFKLGNRSERGISGDFSNKFSDNLRYRLVADYNKQKGELNGTWLESYYLAPSLTWDISDRTALTLLSSVQKEVGVPTTGFFPMQGTLDTTQGKIDRRTNLGDPTVDYLDRKQYSLGYELTHKFDDSLQFSQNYKFNMQDARQLATASGGVTAFPTIAQGEVFNEVISRAHTIDNRFTKSWKTDRLENHLTAGVDYQYLRANGFYTSWYVPVANNTLDVFKPHYNGNTVPQNVRPVYDVTQRQLGIYIQDHFSIDNWRLNVGVRNDRAKGEEGANNYKLNHTSYSGGVMYVADNGVMPYFSYTESFMPETAQYKPAEGRQYETGFKYLPTFINGMFSVAYFDLKQKNAFTPNATGNATQRDFLRSKGVELNADFHVAEKTAVTLAYTFNHVDQYSSGTKLRPALLPRHTASAQLSQQLSDNLTVGVAVRYVGTSANGTADNIKVPARTLADLMVKYQINKNWVLQGNVTNLTDKKYVASCFYSSCYYGEGRRITANVTYKF